MTSGRRRVGRRVATERRESVEAEVETERLAEDRGGRLDAPEWVQRSSAQLNRDLRLHRRRQCEDVLASVRCTESRRMTARASLLRGTTCGSASLAS